MKYVPWFAAVVFGLSTASAQAEQQAPDDPHSKLAFFEGQWTVEGQESTYKEVCEWFPNRRFLICKAEDREGATPAWTMSIFGHSTEKSAYTHTLFGGSGMIRTIHGWLNGSTWTFTGETQAGGETKRTQITIKPTKKGFVFRQDASVNGAPWKKAAEFTYVRIP